MWSSKLHRHEIVFPEGRYLGVVIEIKPELFLPYWKKWMPEVTGSLNNMMTALDQLGIIPLSVSSPYIFPIIQQLYSFNVPNLSLYRIKVLELLY